MSDLLGELSGEDDLGDLTDLCINKHKQARITARFMTKEKGFYNHVWNNNVWKNHV